MQTNFSETQLKDKDNQSSEKIFKKCVHCGMCNATCPTYGILGDELDGPRGRIYLIKDMLENNKKPTEKVVKHIDRCLSCYSCMTTCPAGVNYMHLIDHGKKYIEKNYERSFFDKLIRYFLSVTLPNTKVFKLSSFLVKLSKPFNNSSENPVISKNHCDNFLRSTTAPDLHPFPFTTCSFAKTVSSTGSQFT